MIVEHLDSSHETSDADTIIWRIANFFSLVVNGVEFADFVGVTDSLEQRSNGFTVTGHLEV